ncbi:MAG: arylsulfatase [Candidatus Solibacter sp.]
MDRRQFLCATLPLAAQFRAAAAARQPNIVYMYADDLGFGDTSCYGATSVKTPNLDRAAAAGIRFTNAHSSSATCTPSRYSLLTGEYAFRQKGTAVLPGDATLIVKPGRYTLPGMLKEAGYRTGVVGKWHLGLGEKGTGDKGLDWNGDISPGPLDVGFDYSFILPATGDRTPCVYVENRRVVNLDPKDPIRVDYEKPIAGEPTYAANPELLRMRSSHGHDQAVINGVGRIGYMSGGKSARWVDEDIADTITGKAVAFIEQNRARPFFLYFATHDIHVPRIPNKRFAGKTGMGPRGDAIAELDWSIGRILDTLERLKLTRNTLFIFSSDNGPVVDDGYQDQAVEKLGTHKPAGPLRGGKYSAFDGGTRVPFVVRWPGTVKPGVSAAAFCQVDLLASLASLAGRTLPETAAPDSFNLLPVLLGKSKAGRPHIVEHANALSLIVGEWKVIQARNGQKRNLTGNELGNDPQPQLFNLANDLAEQNNLAAQYPERVKEMLAMLAKIESDGRSRPH